MFKRVCRRLFSVIMAAALISTSSAGLTLAAESVPGEEVVVEQEADTSTAGEAGGEKGADNEGAAGEAGGEKPVDKESAAGETSESVGDEAVSNNDASSVIDDSTDTVSGDEADTVSENDADSVSNNTVSGDTVSRNSVSGDNLPVPVSVSGNEPEIVKGDLKTGIYTGTIKDNTNLDITVIVQSDTDVSVKFESNLVGGDATELFADIDTSYTSFYDTLLSNGKKLSYYRTYITSIDLNNISDITGGTDSGTVFTQMTNLKNVKIGSSLGSISDFCFRRCFNLENVIVYGSGITSIGEMPFGVALH